jgi:putative addiction module killer protein
MTTMYRDWINRLRDPMARARIQVRIDRLAHGNPGVHRVLREGVSELKITVGPGYRVYYTATERARSNSHETSPKPRLPTP